MPLSQLLFSFQGRINRKPWWLVGLALLGIMLVLSIAAAVVAGSAIINDDPMAMIGALGGMVIFFLVLMVPLIWIGLALGAKRLHDRNKSAWWLLVFYVLPGIVDAIGNQFGVSFIFSLAAFALSIWGLVEMGFLRGTIGPNQYGPDPLQQPVGYATHP
jgi:uncharacterized membrane protein YhaH (DUF805 family)